MKKVIYSFLVFLFAVGLNLAQAQVRFDLGVKGGLNFASLSSVSTAASTTYNNRTGYHFGAYALIKITKIGIQPELLFSRQGQNFTLGSQDYSSSFDYIAIPVMIKFYVAGGLNLQAGPQFGFLSSAKGDLINIASKNVSATDQDLSTFVKSSDVSLAVGAGWDLPFGLNITARYNIGLSDVNKYTGSNQSIVSSLGTQEAKNQVVQLSIGYRLFKLGK
jgi:hypothetical protein